ncbi:hypothetical protein L1987_20195 [Smallanthus sonchifolius]|uniref:Uncharacterized protein n=1 Tax=Smallanthus sonchifolius TaxID=185202 RepID=A0ACB9IT74_9ASTR|nr:hypothetical protein L1987_20195 [Smallanthus sonchifolius]
MCISATTSKKPIVLQQYVAPKGLYPVAVPVDTDLTNITVYIGNMTLLLYCSKGCEFVQFTTRTSTEEETQRMHGSQIGELVVHLSWGKSKRDSSRVLAPLAHPTQWSSAHYGYGQGYDAYAYGTTQDPSLYAYGAYGGYMQYPQQGQVNKIWEQQWRCCTTCAT